MIYFPLKDWRIHVTTEDLESIDKRWVKETDLAILKTSLYDVTPPTVSIISR